jgi:hypothetical protein
LSVTDSRLARFVAGREWPDVQTQAKYADGAFWFTSAGHGGTVVRLDRFSAEAQTALRAAGLVEYVVVRKHANATKLYYSRDYNHLNEYAERNGFDLVEFAVGEEDCGYADLFFVNDSLREAANAKMGGSHTRDEVADTVKNWNVDFYEALTGETVTADESFQVRKREFAASNADNYVTKAAWGDSHDEVESGFVGVVARRASDGDERYFLVSQDDYDNRSGSYVVKATDREWGTTMAANTKQMVAA